MSLSTTRIALPVYDLQIHQTEDVICLDRVSFSYGDRPVLQDVTLHVRRGATLGIIGPNGGGKTTLLKLMLGSLTPQSGSVRVLGLRPKDACAKGNLVGYVPQRHLLDWSFPISVRQVVELGLAGRAGMLGRFESKDRPWIDELLASVGMAQLAEQPIGALSGGQQQRVFIARALVARPQVLFLDEPMTGIDQSAAKDLAKLLQDVKRRFGLTLAMVSHNLRAIMAGCDKVACLNRTLHYHDDPAALSREVLQRTFQGDLEPMETHWSPLNPAADAPRVPLGVTSGVASGSEDRDG